MEKFIQKIGGPKIAILLATILGVLLIFGITASGGSRNSQDIESHGHSHD